MKASSKLSSCQLHHVIEEREHELVELRKHVSIVHTAEAEEMNRKLIELSKDFHHNLELLSKRDDIITMLQKNIKQIKGEHSIDMEDLQNKIIKEANEQMKKRITQDRLEVGKEYSLKIKIMEEEINIDSQRKLLEASMKVENEIKYKLSNINKKELENQRRELVSVYENTLSKKEDDYIMQLERMKKHAENIEKERHLMMVKLESDRKQGELNIKMELEEEKKSNNSLTSAKNRLENELKDVNHICREHLIHIEHFGKEKEKLERACINMKESLEELKEESKAKEIKIEELISTIQIIEGAFISVQNKLLKDKELLSHKHIAEIEDLNKKKVENESKIIDFKLQIKDLTEKFNGLDQHWKEKEKDWKKNEKEIKGEKDVIQEKESCYLSQITRLNNEMKDIQSHHDLLQTEKDSGQSTIKSLEKELNDTKYSLFRLQQECQHVKEKGKSKHGKKMEKKYENQLEQLIKKYNHNIQKASKKCKSIMRENYAANEKVRMLQEKYDNLRYSIFDGEEKTTHLESIHNNISRDIDQSHGDTNIKKKCHEHHDEATREKILQLDNENAALRSLIASMRKEIESIGNFRNEKNGLANKNNNEFIENGNTGYSINSNNQSLDRTFDNKLSETFDSTADLPSLLGNLMKENCR